MQFYTRLENVAQDLQTPIDEMVRAVTRVKYCVEKLVETAVKEDADDLIGSDGGPTFMDCLKACQEQLRVAKARSKAACCAERMFPTALRRENRLESS